MATASAGSLTVTAEARPVEYVWDFDDGAQRTTRGPGRKWTRHKDGSIGHLFETKGIYNLGVEVVWEARWRQSGGTWQHLDYFSTWDSDEYPVREVVALLVRAR